MKVIAFLGTGIMGSPMVRNLCKAGYHVKAWNRTPEKSRKLLEVGAEPCLQAVDAVRDADCVVVMLSTGDVVDRVLFSDNLEGQSVATAASPGVPFVVMSSIPVDVARAQASRLSGLGHPYIDAPVSGGENGAIQGTLTIMAGGEPQAIEAVSEVLGVMGRVTRVGPSGSGQLAKLANQIIVGVTIGAVAEALLLAAAGGADLRAVREALMGGFADSAILRQHGVRMIEENFRPGARSHVQLKDLRTAARLARDLGVELPITSLVEQLYADMCAQGRADLDHSALFVALRDRMRR